MTRTPFNTEDWDTAGTLGRDGAKPAAPAASETEGVALSI